MLFTFALILGFLLSSAIGIPQMLHRDTQLQDGASITESPDFVGALWRHEDLGSLNYVTADFRVPKVHFKSSDYVACVVAIDASICSGGMTAAAGVMVRPNGVHNAFYSLGNTAGVFDDASFSAGDDVHFHVFLFDIPYEYSTAEFYFVNLSTNRTASKSLPVTATTRRCGHNALVGIMSPSYVSIPSVNFHGAYVQNEVSSRESHGPGAARAVDYISGDTVRARAKLGSFSVSVKPCDIWGISCAIG